MYICYLHGVPFLQRNILNLSYFILGSRNFRYDSILKSSDPSGNLLTSVPSGYTSTTLLLLLYIFLKFLFSRINLLNASSFISDAIFPSVSKGPTETIPPGLELLDVILVNLPLEKHPIPIRSWKGVNICEACQTFKRFVKLLTA